MTNNQSSAEFDAMEQLKHSLELHAPESIDFSQRIMNRIGSDLDSTRSLSAGHARPRRKVAYMTAAAVISVMLLSGLTYAAAEGWVSLVSLTDKTGNTVMEVNHTDLEAPRQEERILGTLKAGLQPGEAIHAVFGREAIDAVKRGEQPSSYSSIAKGYTYTSAQALVPHLQDVLTQIKLPGDKIQDTVFANVELIPDVNMSSSLEPQGWTEAVDAETAIPYAYQTAELTGKSSFVRFTYQKGDTIYHLNITGTTKETAQFYDSNPSSSNIHDIAGTQVYKYSDEDGSNQQLVWNQKVEGGSLFFSLLSTANDTDNQLAFAEAIVTAYSADTSK